MSERSTDPEVVAMAQVARAIESLDRPAARRVLDWARGRFVDLVPPEEMDLDFFSKFVAAARQASQELGEIAPLDLVKAMIAAKQQADEEKAA